MEGRSGGTAEEVSLAELTDEKVASTIAVGVRHACYRATELATLALRRFEFEEEHAGGATKEVSEALSLGTNEEVATTVTVGVGYARHRESEEAPVFLIRRLEFEEERAGSATVEVSPASSIGTRPCETIHA